jgi:hypothetical protein
MYKDYRAEQIANEDNFKRLSLIIEEDLEIIDHEAYSYKPMKIYDLIRDIRRPGAAGNSGMQQRRRRAQGRRPRRR